VIWLIAYDIADDRRREAVSATLSACGARVQLSVFECELPDPVALTVLLARLREAIDADDDQIRMYPLPLDVERQLKILGNRTLEERRDFYIV